MSDALLIANRGEIAVRIMRSAPGRTIAIAPDDDLGSLHVRTADDHVTLPGTGVAAYLDVDAVVAAAVESGADALHPGYGFLAEDARLALACAAAGITFIGPEPAHLALFGTKTDARKLAQSIQVPVARGTDGAVDGDAAAAWARDFGGPVMIKAAAGGGGRGMAVVQPGDDVAAAAARCSSEAAAAFGNGSVFVEEFIDRARHIEVQIIGDGSGGVSILGDRDCSLQRRRQKVVEWAPAALSDAVRAELYASARRLAEVVRYRSLGTFEFLVSDDDRIHFLEANARIQVEHTVTEELTGLDLVALQLAVAAGNSLDDLGLPPVVEPAAGTTSVQLRVNAERVSADGVPTPSIGEITDLRAPFGPGIRLESGVVAGSLVGPRYDSLIAKVVVTSASSQIVRRVAQALDETRIGGIGTNLPMLRALTRYSFPEQQFDIGFLERVLPELEIADDERTAATSDRASDASSEATAHRPLRDGEVAVEAQLVGVVASLAIAVGDQVAAGTEIGAIEAMKMEHPVHAPVSGVITEVRARTGDAVAVGDPIVVMSPVDVDGPAGAADDPAVELDHIRPDLAEVIERHEVGLDGRRPDAVARRHDRGRRTARENVADLLDDGSFVEYGALVLAAQRRRRSVEELIEKTPGDGLVGGVGSIGADVYDDARVAVMTYDYTVLAGTQGGQNHRKKDRLFEIAKRWNLPVVVFAEGGGGRPGDTDGIGVAGLDCLAFWYFAELSGQVPLVGINTGYCFAGNAALLGMCDVIISTRNANLGMGGPAMIEGGGLGVFHPSEVGPVEDQWANGDIDILVDDDAEAVAVAQRYLSYFRGPIDDWSSHDQRELRHVIPENRLRMYNVRRAIELMADVDSVLELRAGFGPGMVTALARVEGRPVGIVANDPAHLAGAIDSDGADKASRFMQLCDAFGLPIVFLCDTPGIMVGPEAERSGTVRHAARMFVTGASLQVPFCTVVLRKGYGLGAQAMAGGSFKAPIFTVSWPTGEFGGMGLEGAVKLGYRNELAAIDDPAEREKSYGEMVDRMYQVGKALNFASVFELDDVIDPADTRRWITGAFDAAGPASVGPSNWNRRPMVDPY